MKKKGNYSRDTFDPEKHYVGVRLQQGVPLVDADWNEQEDVRRFELRSFLRSFVGDGVPKGNEGFEIRALDPPANGFEIGGGDGRPEGAGRILVGGWEVQNEKHVLYTGQRLYGNDALANEWGVAPLPELEPPTGQRVRIDRVMLDVWEREVDSDEDPDIEDPRIGSPTCVRRKREWVVRVFEGGDPPQPDDGHLFYCLATLKRVAGKLEIEAGDITDRRRQGLAMIPGFLTVDEDRGKIGIGTTGPQASVDIREAPTTVGLGTDIWLRAGAGEHPDQGRFWVEYGPQAAPLLVLSDYDDPPRIQFQQTGREETESEADPKHASWIGHAKQKSSDIAIMGGSVGIGTENPVSTLDVKGRAESNDVRVLRVRANGKSIESVGIDAEAEGWPEDEARGRTEAMAVKGRAAAAYWNVGVHGVAELDGGRSEGSLGQADGEGDYVGVSGSATGERGSSYGRLGQASADGEYVGVYGSAPDYAGYFNGTVYAKDMRVRANGKSIESVGIDAEAEGWPEDEAQGRTEAMAVKGRAAAAYWNVGVHGVAELDGGRSEGSLGQADGEGDYVGVSGSATGERGSSYGRLGQASADGEYVGVYGSAPDYAGYFNGTVYAKDMRVRANGKSIESVGIDAVAEGWPEDDAGGYTDACAVSGSASAAYYNMGVKGTAQGARGQSDGRLGVVCDDDEYIGVYGSAPDYAGYFDGNVYARKIFVNKGKLNTTRHLYLAGDAYCTGTWQSAGGDYAENFESADGSEIPLGTTVALAADGKIRPAADGDEPIGVVCQGAAVVGGVYDEWPKKYLQDEFGTPVMEEVRDEPRVPRLPRAEAGEKKPVTKMRPRINPEYDKTREYLPRETRPEWHRVGLLGQLRIRRGQPLAKSWRKLRDVSENVELWLVR